MRRLKSSDPVIRAAAAEALGEMGLKAKYAVPYLSKAILDENKDVRVAAVRAIGKIGASSEEGNAPNHARIASEIDLWEMEAIYVQSLVDVMLIDKEEDVRGAAKEALVRLGERATRTLADYLTRRRWGEISRIAVRREIGKVLKRIRTEKCQKLVERGDPVAIQSLIYMMLSSFDSDVQGIARDALFTLGERAIPHLEERLTMMDPIVENIHYGRGGVKMVQGTSENVYYKEVAALINEIKEESMMDQVAGNVVNRIARGEDINMVCAQALWDLEWKAKADRTGAVTGLTQKIYVHSEQLDVEKVRKAVAALKRFDEIASSFIGARRDLRYFSSNMPDYMLNKPISFQEVLQIVQTYLLHVNSEVPVSRKRKRIAEALISFILNRARKARAINQEERSILAGNRHVLSYVLMTVSHSLTPVLIEDRINSVITDYTQLTDLYEKLGEEGIIEGYAQAMREVEIKNVYYYDVDYGKQQLHKAFEVSVSVGKGEEKEDIGYAITFNENGTPYRDGNAQRFVDRFGALRWMALRDQFRSVRIDPEIFKEAFRRAAAVDRARAKERTRTQATTALKIVLPGEKGSGDEQAQQPSAVRPSTPLDRMKGVLPLLIIAMQTLNYSVKGAVEEAAEREGEAVAEREGRIIIAIDDDLGSGWTQKKVQDLRKTLSLLTRRHDKLGELTRRIEVRHGEGVKLAGKLTTLVDSGKVVEKNIIIVANEKNRKHFKRFDGISTMTCINEGNELELDHYYPLVEVVLYTLARALMNKGASGYDRITVRNFYEFISNIE
ncbi:MAG: HEAT repeat domain-containing protein, partial [Candidatus Omnitrophota bacterium]